MDRVPEIGERVRYTSARYPERTLLGTVRAIYPGDRTEDDEGEVIIPVRVGDPDWDESWHASVEPDELPAWWQYGEHPRFAPSISELVPA